MLITFKTTEQKTFKIEVDEDKKVKDLKEKIAEEKGNDQYPVAGQKLIYAGKILDDEKLIADYKIDPVKNFIVVMVIKPKKIAEKPKEPESSSSQPSQSPEAFSAKPETPQATSSDTSVSQTVAETSATGETVSMESTATESENTANFAESALLTGSALESSITELMSFGYSREQVMRALNRSFHNADRAAEYLLAGNIPDDSEGEDLPAISATPSVETVEAGDLSFLRSLPQFQLMRSQVQADRSRLPELLQEIGRANPQLLSIISQNQEAFIALLNERIPPEGDAGGEEGSQGGAGALQIQVTPSEKEAIDRMISMGFQREEVIQAFFACEKNEQLAVEFLLKE